MRYVFANCELDTEHGVLSNGTKQGKLKPKLMQVLCYLLEHADRIVSRKELAQQFWPDSDANETALVNTIRALWIAVGDNARNPTMIKPLANHGYRIAVPVTVIAEAGGETDVHQHDTTVRRQLTVLFCDLTVSTMPSVGIEPEDHVEVVQACHDACTTAITEYTGQVIQSFGDGFLAWFGYPHAHEDNAPRAVYSALGILDAVDRLNEQLRSSHGATVTAQIGIHTGATLISLPLAASREELLA